MASRRGGHLGLATLFFGVALLWHGGAWAAQLRLTWTNNAFNASGLLVERSEATPEAFSEIAALAPGLASYLDTGLIDGTAYCYRVRVFSGADFSEYSNIACGVAKEGGIFAAVLPGSRSVLVGGMATAFGTILNVGPSTATACAIAMGTSLPATFSYQTTDPTTNAPTGEPNVAVDILPGQAQTYVFALTPTSPIYPTEVALDFQCANRAPAPVIVGVSTFLLSASAAPVADVVADAVTLGQNGIMDLSGDTGTGLFALGSSNLGATTEVTVGADTGGASLPLTLTVCETDSATGTCLLPPAPTVTVTYVEGTTRSFAVFAQASAAIPFDPTVNRVFVRFWEADLMVRGRTSVAVRTP